MAAKVGPSAVSYRIGVQNRYSAFLDEEDGFGSPVIQLSTAATKSHVVDSKKSGSLPRSSTKLNGNKANNGKQDSPQKVQANANGIKSNNKFDLNRRQKSQQQQQPRSNQAQNGTQQSRQATNRQVNYQSSANANGNQGKLMKNQQQNQENSNNAANHSLGGKSYHRGPKDQRLNGRPAHPSNRGPDDDQQGNSNSDGAATVACSFGPSSEEKKLRRHQKRVNDLRHKDPEKRESRRSRVSSNVDDDQAHNDVSENHVGLEHGAESWSRPRVFRKRREEDRMDASESIPRGSKMARGRPRRGQDDGEGESSQGERRTDNQQQERRRFDGERSQRNRSGFGRSSGLRGAAGNQRIDGGNRVQERQKPIPNFSDKSDFPSLAS